MQTQVYLFFDGRTDEALDFYTTTLGIEVEMLMRFKDAPQGSMPGECGPALGDKIMHAALKIGDTTVMASDGRMQGKPAFQGISLSLDLKTKSDAERTFRALSEGGQVQQPLIETFFSPAFGMVADRFGVSWMVLVPGKQ